MHDPDKGSRAQSRFFKKNTKLECLHLKHANPRKGLRAHRKNRRKNPAVPGRAATPKMRRAALGRGNAAGKQGVVAIAGLAPPCAVFPFGNASASAPPSSSPQCPQSQRSARARWRQILACASCHEAAKRRRPPSRWQKQAEATSVFAHQSRRSPQRFARATHESQKARSFCTSTTIARRSPQRRARKPRDRQLEFRWPESICHDTQPELELSNASAACFLAHAADVCSCFRLQLEGAVVKEENIKELSTPRHLRRSWCKRKIYAPR